MMGGYGWSGVGFLWMIVVSLFWLAVLGVLIWALVRCLDRRTHTLTTLSTGNGQSALDILRERYAGGEIDATTFEQMRERLESGAHLPSKPRDAGESTAL